MKKGFMVLLALVAAFAFSGCCVLSSHTAVSDDGTGNKTVFGILGFGAIDNGYPLLPLYSSYEQAPQK